ncbi:MAG: zinc ribbon domain-containing protein [Methanobrevibacter sp.]|nr:zinc ribbon domain-containing protein [Methanobrevibacter sp.]
MYCRKCGESNPDNAVFCRNCGEKLKEEEVKKTEVIEATPNRSSSNESSTTKTGGKSNDSTLMGCCGCLILIFIVGAIMSLLGL